MFLEFLEILSFENAQSVLFVSSTFGCDGRHSIVAQLFGNTNRIAGIYLFIGGLHIFGFGIEWKVLLL